MFLLLLFCGSFWFGLVGFFFLMCVFPHNVWYLLCHSLYSTLYRMQISTEQQLEKMLNEGVWVSAQEMLLGFRVWRRKFLFLACWGD